MTSWFPAVRGFVFVACAGWLLAACNTPSQLCDGLLTQFEACEDYDFEAEERTEFTDECVDSFEDAQRDDPECFTASQNLASCINDLSCSQWEEYWGGDPWDEAGYPCHAEDVEFYVDGGCSDFLF